MRILVTGGNGFIGKHLVTSLRKKGHTVLVVPREVFNDPRHLEPFLAASLPVDAIYHLASYGNHYHQTDASEAVQVNYAGIFNLLTATKAIPYKAFVNVSSSSVLLPYETVYSATKAGAERLVRAFAYQFEKPIITLRPYSIYGEGEAAHRFIPKVFESFIYGTELTLAPEPVHDWVHVADFVRAMEDSAELLERMKKPLIEEYSVGTGVGTSNQAVVDIVQRITKKKTIITKQKTLRAYDTKEWIADTRWDGDMIQLEDGLQRYYDWYNGGRTGGEEKDGI